jgi:hypothetical protein
MLSWVGEVVSYVSAGLGLPSRLTSFSQHTLLPPILFLQIAKSAFLLVTYIPPSRPVISTLSAVTKIVIKIT